MPKTPIIYITRRARFSACHRLHNQKLDAATNKQIFGKCNNPNGHGHNYQLFVTLKGKADPKTGMLLNLTQLDEIIEKNIINKFDHKNLNLDVSEFADIITTAENICFVIWQILEDKLPTTFLYEVKLLETENNFAIYRGE
jgi:6-pyruvoyltetrahydropterin/6-carboxytetrahydropterin synthase